MDMTNEELANELAGRVGALRDAHMPTTAAVAEEAAARLRQQYEDSANLDWLAQFLVLILAETNLGATAVRDALVHVNETLDLREALTDMRLETADKDHCHD